MSLTSKILIRFLQLSGMKGKLAKGSQKTFEEAVSYNRKHPFIMPHDHKAIYEQIDIQTGFGIYPCVKITQPGSCQDHAVLFTWGGGGAWGVAMGAHFLMPEGPVKRVMTGLPAAAPLRSMIFSSPENTEICRGL